ncbi:activating signal cointegrator 1 complex protein [Pyrenophora tritici-repentis]|uniref:Uncharacterized protein n=1 Tax=Pyrenophora tritici-repentis TaxID=45151 RepID=A0A834VKX8_9PLEO|nr:hypothetical protein PtrM4_150290 [Pyrenophora tritici-repentis]KAI2475763.1 activating signal cointegrator 1 complex protein [Pyrenophora tritici-repentis]
MCRTDKSDTTVLELRSTGTTKDLENIQDTKISELTLLGIVDLGTLDENCGGRQVDTPSESRCTAEYLEYTFGKQALNHVPVGTGHTGMMSSHAFA